MYACTQLAEHSIQLRNREMSPELFNGNTTSSSLPTNIMIDNTFDTQNEEEEEGDIFKAKSYDSIHDLPQSFDVNDGPDLFNTQHSPHPHQLTYATFPKPLHGIKSAKSFQYL
ncbi:hypothetical protein QTP88_004569 [Uroleucon formosanum]